MSNLPIKTAFATAFWLLSLAALADEGIPVKVVSLATAPEINGRLDDWPAKMIRQPGIDAQAINILSPELVTLPSYVNSPEEQKQAIDWQPRPRLLAGVHGDRLYLAAQWYDEDENSIYRPWKKRGSRYRRDRKRDDMFALRFDHSGDFSNCMMSGDDYVVDIWRWSAGRSDLSGIADDMTHRYSISPIEAASVYPSPSGSVYFRKDMDPGTAGWAYTRPPENGSKHVAAGVTVEGKPEGSRADVSAKATWENGVWTLELSRKLKTDDLQDAEFKLNGKHKGQIAIFNAGYQMRKQITPTLVFDFSGIDKQ